MNLTRRNVHRLGLGCLAAAWATGGLARPLLADHPDKFAPVLKTDSEFGSYTQSWFLQSFLNLSEDLEAAAARGKRFAIMWDLDGCPYCRETHLVNFGKAGITDYVRANFDILQLDLRGSQRVTDFDGKEMSEKELARRHGVRFTPTIQFFPETAGELKGKTRRQTEVARMPGYFKPAHFLSMFRFVREKAYEKSDFRSYLKSGASTVKGQG
ncbi:MAG: thioredoxin family protein [Rhodospirillaceae bacterium]